MVSFEAHAQKTDVRLKDGSRRLIFIIQLLKLLDCLDSCLKTISLVQ